MITLQLGKTRTYSSPEGDWTTATYKETAEGPLELTRNGFAGDEQADRKNHGGPEKAVLVYSADHYADWYPGVFPEPLPHGAFGENITVSGIKEADVCVGDIYRLGSSVVQVSQPRQPCWKQARRWQMKDLVLKMIETCRSGWYVRVLEEGTVDTSDSFLLTERPHPEWSVARAHHVMHYEKNNPALSHQLAACPALAASWTNHLRAR